MSALTPRDCVEIAPAQTPWPIVPAFGTALSEAERRAVRRVADTLRPPIEQDRARVRWPGVDQGWRPGPTLYLEDHRRIDLIPESSAVAYEYRMLGLADAGDLYVVSEPKRPSFERELSEQTGFGAPDVVEVSRMNAARLDSLALAASADASVLRRCVETARRHGGLNTVAFQTDETVYELAGDIARRAGAPVRVCGPDPALSGRANSKLWFCDMVMDLLGEDSVPDFRPTATLHRAAESLIDMVQRHPSVAVKVPSSAGGLGNIRFSRDTIRALGLSGVEADLASRLHARGWRSGTLMVCAWDEDVVMSPSVQVWVPCTGAGAPVIEGLFAQQSRGANASFAGATRLELPPALMQHIIGEAAQIATLLQDLGYQGRLSLDLALVANPDARALSIKWIEANARWGGVSIPMTVGHRLNAGESPCDLVVFQRRRNGASDELERIRSRGVIPLSPGPSPSGYLHLLPPDGDVTVAVVYGVAVAALEAEAGVAARAS